MTRTFWTIPLTTRLKASLTHRTACDPAPACNVGVQPVDEQCLQPDVVEYSLSRRSSDLLWGGGLREYASPTYAAALREPVVSAVQTTPIHTVGRRSWCIGPCGGKRYSREGASATRGRSNRFERATFVSSTLYKTYPASSACRALLARRLTRACGREHAGLGVFAREPRRPPR